MAKFSPAVAAARSRRAARAGKRSVEIEWFINEVSDKIELTMNQRVRIATELVKTKVVQNISRPVTKIGRRVTDRSKPGEFPKADTTQLMKSIFSQVKKTAKGIWDGFIGTPLDYGLILETRRERSFLKRTLDEELPKVKRILSGPVK